MKYVFRLEVEAPDNTDADEIGGVLNSLINIGLSDASYTVEDGIESEEAELALKLDIGNPEELTHDHPHPPHPATDSPGL